MSTLRGSYDRTVHTSNGPSELELLIRGDYPNLADALFGVSAVDGQGSSLPSCSIILFVEGDRLKFCLTPQGSDRVAFGVILEPTQGFSSLEKSLAAGEFGWRPKKGRR